METSSYFFKVDKYSSLIDSNPVKHKPMLEKILRHIPHRMKNQRDRLEVFIYTRIMEGIRAMLIQILSSSSAWLAINAHKPVDQENGFDQGISQLTLNLAEQLGILRNKKFTSRYHTMLPIDLCSLVNNDLTVNRIRSMSGQLYAREIQALMGMKVISQKNQAAELYDELQDGELWLELKRSKLYDYHILLCGYLLELVNVNLRGKTSYNNCDSFATMLGNEAFERYNQDSFCFLIKKLDQIHPIKNVLDIGCGYGDYSACVLGLTEAKIIGLERQHEVVVKTQNRFKEDRRITILSTDVNDFKPETTFDLIMLNYVTFYLSESEQNILYAKIKNHLSATGTLLICQYFPDMSNTRRKLSSYYNHSINYSRKIELYFVDRLVLAESLLNETLDTFHRVERWLPFNQRLENAGLTVKALSGADPFYYSKFIHIGHQQ